MTEKKDPFLAGSASNGIFIDLSISYHSSRPMGTVWCLYFPSFIRLFNVISLWK